MLNQKIWNLENGKEINTSIIDENRLEKLIVSNVDIINPNWLLIGEQVHTNANKYIDLLCMEPDGDLVVVELKRDMTPREVTAQVIDYAASVSKYTMDDILNVYTRFAANHNTVPSSLAEAYKGRFNNSFELDDETVNKHVKMVIVASEMDPSTERIITFLRETYQVDINIMFFSVYSINGSNFLSRVWFSEDLEENASVIAVNDDDIVWNGYTLVNFGGTDRKWSDAITYGFVSAGGSPWYSNTFKRLEQGEKVFVNIPKKGYVGYGIIEETAVMAKDIIFEMDGRKIGFNDIDDGSNYLHDQNDEEKAEYVVKIKWIYTEEDESKAIKEPGFFGNQNSACRPKKSKWDTTVKRLKQIWNLND